MAEQSPKLAAMLNSYAQVLSSHHKLMIYGANGYTAELVLKTIKDILGVQFITEHVVLAGRTEKKLLELLDRLQIQKQRLAVFDLSSVDVICSHLQQVQVVLHCAGPFMQTAFPMIKACVKSGVSYLDITGEYPVFDYVLSDTNEASKKLQAEAQKKGIVIMPGVGYDVVPTDCLAKLLSEEFERKFPSSQKNLLEMAMTIGTTASHGTMKTMVAGMAGGNVTRANGIIQKRPMRVKKFNFVGKNLNTVTVPWGDIVTAFYSTGKTPNINVYFSSKMPDWFLFIYNLTITSWVMYLLFSIPGVISFLQWVIEKALPRGPSEEELRNANNVHIITGELTGVNENEKVSATIQVSTAYKLTADTALVSAIRVLANKDLKAVGCTTPSVAFGSDFIFQFDNCKQLN